jgi:hypothetical protein
MVNASAICIVYCSVNVKAMLLRHFKLYFTVREKDNSVAATRHADGNLKTVVGLALFIS